MDTLQTILGIPLALIGYGILGVTIVAVPLNIYALITGKDL